MMTVGIPTVTIYPAVFYDYHEHVTYMHQVISHIPFDTATSLIDNAIINDMNGTEETKYDSDNNMNMNVELTTDNIQRMDRPLDAIYIDDDMDESQSIIWVQSRRCKWSCPVESYMVAECS